MNDEPATKPKTSTLPVHWKCGKCHKNARCEVPERARAVDITFWMNSLVIPRIVHSHSLISPKCNPVVTEDGKQILTVAIAFPMPQSKDGVIGQATEEQKEKARAAGFPTEFGKPL